MFKQIWLNRNSPGHLYQEEPFGKQITENKASEGTASACVISF
jgi:hypothetical protein